MTDCRKFDDPDCDKSLRTHVGRNPKGYHELHRRLYEDMSRYLSRKNIVIKICKSGRYRSVANAEMWSKTLTHSDVTNSGERVLSW